MIDADLHNDLIEEAEPIAVFIWGDAKHARRVYHLATKGELPIFRMNGKLCARKSALREAIAEKERQALGSIARKIA